MISLNTKYSQVSQKTPRIDCDIPLFARYVPDISAIQKAAKRFGKKRSMILIGNGGSITSFDYYKTALGTDMDVWLVSTMEPDYLYKVRKLCNPKDTIVIVVSLSGSTVGVIESLLYFIDYPSIIVVTAQKNSALKQIQERHSLFFVEHPPVGGRYSGFTPSGLLPAAIAGIDIKEIWAGAQKGYQQYAPSVLKANTALQLAYILYQLDKKKYTEIFMPIYSTRLDGSKQIITQLIHESCGKEGKGQTVVAALAPESQHHTNQRFFGGRKNMVGCFVCVENQDHKYDLINVKQSLQDIHLRDGTLADIHQNLYSHALYAEYVGTQKDAAQNAIPHVTIMVPEVSPYYVGMYLALWHYTTVYLCTLLGVDPYDQPQVESSKQISFVLRRKKTKIKN